MKSYTIEELSKLYKKKTENTTHKVEDQTTMLFTSLSSEKIEPMKLNISKDEEFSSAFNSQLTFNAEEEVTSQQELRRKKREQNPLYQNWKEVCSHLDDSMTFTKSKNSIQSNSRKIRRVLHNEEDFQQSLRDSTSETYDALVVDLLELNRHKINSLKTYSENIDEYFRSKTGQSLFEISNKNHENLRKIINDSEFPKYYEYGYHSKETEKPFDLKIDKNFLNIFKEIVYNNLKSNNFNLLSEKICESPNNYEIVNSNQHMQHIKKKTRTL